MKRILQVFRKNNTTGIALCSGGAKGLSQLPILEYLEDHDIKVDLVVGTSIGAILGAIYAKGNLKKFKKDILSISKKEVFNHMDLVVPKHGWMRGKRVMKYIQKYIPKSTKFEDLDIPLKIVATNYATGEAHVFDKGNVHNAIRASISIPAALVPHKVGNHLYIDGGVSNPLPIDILYKEKIKNKIAVNLHSHLMVEHKLKQPNSEHPLLRRTPQWITNLIKKNNKDIYPNMLNVIMRAIEVTEYYATQHTIYKYKPNILIEPNVKSIHDLEFYKSKLAYERGEQAYHKVIDKLKQLPKNK